MLECAIMPRSWKKTIGYDVAAFPGAGAAGGLGAAIGGVLGGTLKSGVEAVLDVTGFDQLLDHADLVITGEGRLDGQSVRFGKAPTGIARRCEAKKCAGHCNRRWHGRRGGGIPEHWR